MTRQRTGYHISKNGKLVACYAQPGKCPVKGSDGEITPHFETAQQYREYIDNIGEQQFGLLSSETQNTTIPKQQLEKLIYYQELYNKYTRSVKKVENFEYNYADDWNNIWHEKLINENFSKDNPHLNEMFENKKELEKHRKIIYPKDRKITSQERRKIKEKILNSIDRNAINIIPYILQYDGSMGLLVVSKINKETVEDMSDLFYNDLNNSGVYNAWHVGEYIGNKSEDFISMNYLPIYGNENHYVTKWFYHDLDKALSVRLKDGNKFEPDNLLVDEIVKIYK